MAKQKIQSTVVLIVAGVAGLIYNSWIIGPLVNPAVGWRGLASELEGKHQPFNWLFITADIISSLIMLGICIYLWRRSDKRMITRGVVLAVALFAIGTIVDAALPIKCDESIQICPSYHQDHLLLVHGLFSIGASLFLFIGLLLLWWRQRRSVLLQAIMFGYILFGIFSFISAIHPGRDSWAQHYYIGLCGICLALLPKLMQKNQDL